jgi:hypothetical protein
MKHISSHALGAVLLMAFAAGTAAAPLTANSGAIAAKGELADGGRVVGSFMVQAVLRDGNFSGSAALVAGGSTVSGPLVEKRSYFENGRCYFRVENGRAHAEVSGKCDSAGMEGRFQSFNPDGAMSSGTAKASFVLAGGTPAAQAARLPSGKLTCAYNEPKIGIRMGEITQYSLRFSNLASLTLDPAGTYVAGNGARGRFTQIAGDKIRLVSGPWEGAIGSLENDRSGAPAVVFHIEENRRPDGIHIVDPYSTHCTKAR